MRNQHLTALLLTLFVLAGAAAPAYALDLNRARADGDRLAQSLEAGTSGNWTRAERQAAAGDDRVLADLVLWRKLNAGQGTYSEYLALFERRPDWPGEVYLGRRYFGIGLAQNQPGMTSRSRKNWTIFSRDWRGRRYDQAEAYLETLTGNPANLGDPGRWADRRHRLAHRAARQGRIDRAYTLASQHFLDASEDRSSFAELEWLAGWIALRRLNNADLAVQHFERFLGVVRTPISIGRGGYWLGRAEEARGDLDAAAVAYRRAADHQTAFYGQLAAERLSVTGDPAMVTAQLPEWERSPVVRNDTVRAAVTLHFAGEERSARQFFAMLGREGGGEAGLGALADLALALERPHYAVRLAKRAAQNGTILYPAYYPVTDLAQYARTVEPALAMSVARQETEFNPRAVSHAGARGLMQLLPSTAKRVAEWIDEPYSRTRLTEDWQYNARLGQAYLARRIEQFGGSYVLAAAAYNAGAHRVTRWIDEFGDPRLPGADMLDWMEMIPFSETRNYVQRVMEGLFVYRTLLSGELGEMSIGADLARGARTAG